MYVCVLDKSPDVRHPSPSAPLEPITKRAASFLTCRVEINLDHDVVINLEEYLSHAENGNNSFVMFDSILFKACNKAVEIIALESHMMQSPG